MMAAKRIKEKICLNCKHYDMGLGSGGEGGYCYSTYSPRFFKKSRVDTSCEIFTDYGICESCRHFRNRICFNPSRKGASPQGGLECEFWADKRKICYTCKHYVDGQHFSKVCGRDGQKPTKYFSYCEKWEYKRAKPDNQK